MSVTLSIESLEPRRLFSTQTLEPGGLLHVVLGGGNERVRVVQHPGTPLIDVLVRREPLRQHDGVTSIRVDGLTGRDVIFIAGNLTIPATLVGGPGRDILIGALGNDTIDGGLGNDYIDGSGGDDTILGGVHDDTISGGDGNDTIDGGLGRDTISGGAGDDLLTGGAGIGRLDGGDGNDRITGGPASDVLTGGAGADTFFLTDRKSEITDLTSDDVRTA